MSSPQVNRPGRGLAPRAGGPRSSTRWRRQPRQSARPPIRRADGTPRRMTPRRTNLGSAMGSGSALLRPGTAGALGGGLEALVALDGAGTAAGREGSLKLHEYVWWFLGALLVLGGSNHGRARGVAGPGRRAAPAHRSGWLLSSTTRPSWGLTCSWLALALRGPGARQHWPRADARGVRGAGGLGGAVSDGGAPRRSRGHGRSDDHAADRRTPAPSHAPGGTGARALSVAAGGNSNPLARQLALAAHALCRVGVAAVAGSLWQSSRAGEGKAPLVSGGVALYGALALLIFSVAGAPDGFDALQPGSAPFAGLVLWAVALAGSSPQPRWGAPCARPMPARLPWWRCWRMQWLRVARFWVCRGLLSRSGHRGLGWMSPRPSRLPRPLLIFFLLHSRRLSLVHLGVLSATIATTCWCASRSPAIWHGGSWDPPLWPPGSCSSLASSGRAA